MSALFKLPKAVPVDSGGAPHGGAKANFFLTGTSTPTDTYTDNARTVAHANPVVADSAGVFAPIYLDPALIYKLTLAESDDTLIYTVDPAVDLVPPFYETSAGETAAGVTPTDFQYEPGNVLRYGTNTTPGTTDMTTAIQNAFDALPPGGEVLFPKGDVYLATDTLTMQANTTIDFRGATLRFKITGKKRCLVTNNFCVVKNGAVDNATTDATAHAGDFQQPVGIGFSNSITDAVHNVTVRNLTVTSTSPESAGVYVWGACYNILVENIDFPDSANMLLPIGAHWSVEPGGDETQGIGHPNNITYRNIRIGVMSYTTTAGAAMWISACRAITLENIFCEDYQGGPIIHVFAGDHGFTYAIDALGQDEGTTLSGKNINGVGLKGISVNMQDTLEAELVWPSSITFEECNMQSRDTTNTASRGIDIAGVEGLTVRNSLFDLFYNGIFLNTRIVNLVIDGVRIHSSNKNGIDESSGNSILCSNMRITRCELKDNNAAGGTGYDMVFGSFMDTITLDGNVFNSPLATNNVLMEGAAPPSNAKVINNHVEAGAGVSFVFGSATSFGICELFNGNTQGETNTNLIRSGQQYVPYAISAHTSSNLAIKYYTGVGTPAYGTYNLGDITYESAPIAAGKIGSVCTASGTQDSYTEGRTATTDGTTTVVLSAASDVLRKGMYLTINATNVRVESLTGTTMITDVTIPSASGQAIAYKNGTWKLFGAINA